MRSAANLVLLATLSADAGAEMSHPQLEALVAEALEHHPALRRARRTAAAAWQVPPRLGALPDPLLSVAVQNFRVDQPGLDTSPMSGIEVSLRQPLPFPGKLGRKAAVASEMARASDRQVEQDSSTIALHVRQTYWRLHFAEQAERIARQNEKVIGTIATTVMNRFSVGQAAQQDALQVQVAHSRVRALVEERHEAVQAARVALNGAVGRQPDSALAPTEEPARGIPHWDRPGLIARALEQSPMIRVRRAQVLVSERTLREASYDRWPDLQLGVGYRFRGVVPGDPSNGADMFGVTFGVTLPVWMSSKQNARVRQEGDELEAARAGVDVAHIDVVTELERTLDAVDRLSLESDLYQKDVGPESRQALDASISDYQRGQVGFVSVLQNWQVELDVELTVVRLLTEREERLAEVQALVGDAP